MSMAPATDFFKIYVDQLRMGKVATFDDEVSPEFLELTYEDDLVCQEPVHIEGEAYVAPFSSSAGFEENLAEFWPKRQKNDMLILEQGPSLSTIRFDRTGEPIVEKDGGFSLVPAGHGALAKLFPAVGARFPAAHSLFI